MNLQCCSTLKSDRVTLHKTHSLLDFRCNFLFGEKASPLLVFFLRENKTNLLRVLDEHKQNKFNGTDNCRKSLGLFATVHSGCNCTMILTQRAECRKC